MTVLISVLAVLSFIAAGASFFGILFSVIAIDDASERARAQSPQPAPTALPSRSVAGQPQPGPERPRAPHVERQAA